MSVIGGESGKRIVRNILILIDFLFSVWDYLGLFHYWNDHISKNGGDSENRFVVKYLIANSILPHYGG